MSLFKKKPKEIAWQSTIELTNLKSPKSKEIKEFVETAIVKGFYGVCLLSGDLLVASKYKTDSLKLITVAGFPAIHMYPLIKDKRYSLLLGWYTRAEISKIKDIILQDTADELDIIFPFYWYAKGNLKRIEWFIRGVKKRFKKPVKVIIELGTLIRSEEEIKKVCDLLKKCNIDFVKTNSGLIPQPSTIALPVSLRLLKKHTKYPIKASGGIRTLEDVKALIDEFGVARIGTSSTTL